MKNYHSIFCEKKAILILTILLYKQIQNNNFSNLYTNEVLSMKYKKNIKKIGIMGGTFDPVHIAHLSLSEYVKEKYCLDKIIFIPLGNAPHKENITPSNHRYNMTKLAIEGNNNFEISSIDIDRNKTTRTIDTLKDLVNIYGKKAQFYFIIGSDNINMIDEWKNIDEIFSICNFIVTTRPNCIIKNDAKNIIEKYKNKIYFTNPPLLEISSSDIRKKVSQEKSIKYIVPKKVEIYINENKLYKYTFFDDCTHYIDKLSKTLTKDRLKHSLRVAKEAKNLAIEYNIDAKKAYIAGLLHDCCKCYDIDKIYQTADKYNFKMDNIFEKQPYLAHSFLGYFVAKNEYLIQDTEILNSIKYHTTGKANMSELEKIVYIADYIEPKRTHNGVYVAREIAYENLNKAMKIILKNTIEFNKNREKIIHHLSEEAYNYYKKEHNNE